MEIDDKVESISVEIISGDEVSVQIREPFSISINLSSVASSSSSEEGKSLFSSGQTIHMYLSHYLILIKHLVIPSLEEISINAEFSIEAYKLPSCI